MEGNKIYVRRLSKARKVEGVEERKARRIATVGVAEHGGDRGVTKIMIDRAIKFRCRRAGGGRAGEG